MIVDLRCWKVTLKPDDRVYENWWNPDAGGWHGWSPVGNKTFEQQSYVTAITMQPYQPQLSDGSGDLYIFAFGSDGKVYTNQRDSFVDWQPQWSQVGIKSFKLRSLISAISRTPFVIDLFAFDSDGKVYHTGHQWNDPWPDWSPVGSRVFKRQGFVTALSRTKYDVPGFAEDRLDIFAFDADGFVYTSSWNPSEGWHDWSQIGGQLGPQYLISAVSRQINVGFVDAYGDPHLFAFNYDGRAFQSRWFNDKWEDWTEVASKIFNLPYVPVTPADPANPVTPADPSNPERVFSRRFFIPAVSNTGNDIAIFASDSDGTIYTAAWDDNTGWHMDPIGVVWPKLPTTSFNDPTLTALSHNTRPTPGGSQDDDIHVFVSDSDGVVSTAWWRGWWSFSQGWHMDSNGNVWSPVAPTNTTAEAFSRSPFISAASNFHNEVHIFAINPKHRTSYVEMDKMRSTKFPPKSVAVGHKIYSLESIFKEAGILLDIIHDETDIPNQGGLDARYSDAELDSFVQAHKNPTWQQDPKKDMAAYLAVVTGYGDPSLPDWQNAMVTGLMWRKKRDACVLFYNNPTVGGKSDMVFLLMSAHQLGHEFNLHHPDGTGINIGSDFNYSIMVGFEWYPDEFPSWPEELTLRFRNQEADHLWTHPTVKVKPGGSGFGDCSEEHKIWHF